PVHQDRRPARLRLDGLRLLRRPPAAGSAAAAERRRAGGAVLLGVLPHRRPRPRLLGLGPAPRRPARPRARQEPSAVRVGAQLTLHGRVAGPSPVPEHETEDPPPRPCLKARFWKGSPAGERTAASS